MLRLSWASKCIILVISTQSEFQTVGTSACCSICLSHRHTRYGIFFHSLAMIACVRKGEVSPHNYARYMRQIELNQQYLRK